MQWRRLPEGPEPIKAGHPLLQLYFTLSVNSALHSVIPDNEGEVGLNRVC